MAKFGIQENFGKMHFPLPNSSELDISVNLEVEPQTVLKLTGHRQMLRIRLCLMFRKRTTTRQLSPIQPLGLAESHDIM